MTLHSVWKNSPKVFFSFFQIWIFVPKIYESLLLVIMRNSNRRRRQLSKKLEWMTWMLLKVCSSSQCLKMTKKGSFFWNKSIFRNNKHQIWTTFIPKSSFIQCPNKFLARKKTKKFVKICLHSRSVLPSIWWFFFVIFKIQSKTFLVSFKTMWPKIWNPSISVGVFCERLRDFYPV